MTESEDAKHDGKRLRRLLRLLLGTACVLFLTVSILRDIDFIRVQSKWYSMLILLFTLSAYVGTGIAVWTKQHKDAAFRPVRWVFWALVGPLLVAVISPACLFYLGQEKPLDLETANRTYLVLLLAGLALTLYNWVTWVLLLSKRN